MSIPNHSQALQALAQFIAELRYEALPTEVLDRAQWVLRDTIGVILGGMAEPEVRALADYAAATAPGPVQIMAHDGQTTPAWAALVHGTAGTTLEMDEGHAFARGHAAIHAAPPALALGQARNASGQDVLTAFVAGYEVAARVGVATRLRPDVHPFGAWGVLGATAVAAWYKGFSAAELAGALELAASYAITPSFHTAYQGANVRNTYAGMVNHLGLLAADFYELGFRGETGGLQTAFGQILGESFDTNALTAELGDRFEIMRGYFKPYSACRYTHAAVDAVLQLRAEGDVDVDAITAVNVETYDIAAHLNDPHPQTPLAGRFSTPYVVAAALIQGSAGPEIFTSQVLGDEMVRRLAARVRVQEDAAFTAMTPARRPARITLHFRDGSQRQHAVFGSKGDPDQPMSETELAAKFHRLASATIGESRASEVWERCGQLFHEPSIVDLMQRLARV